MNKAMLIIDMPESCDECPLMFRHEEERCCMPESRNSFTIKPSWCPLKPFHNNDSGNPKLTLEDLQQLQGKTIWWDNFGGLWCKCGNEYVTTDTGTTYSFGYVLAYGSAYLRKPDTSI